MRLFLLFFLLSPTIALAGGMAGFNVGFGQNTRPFYGVDYEFGLSGEYVYMDAALFGNQDYIQPYLSSGLQFKVINVGVAASATFGKTVQPLFGPEFGVMYNLNRDLYLKENNSVLGLPGKTFSFGSTVSVGVNF